ncbi:excitatory amino acid transporter [Patella vulgata]|uniref:excitatory amino acid transporter n=1 Tax=Patella vulgata TaxID=6465 RepID=UPI0024A7B348|nr:excitatory amino acid transporter [Patella vulgata]
MTSTNNRLHKTRCWLTVSRSKWIKHNLLLILVLLGVIAGFGIGFGVRLTHPSESVLLWTGLPGDLYMRMLKATLLPLIVSSIIAGTSSMDPKSSGKVGSISLAYIIITNGIGSILGLAVGLLINPGEGQSIPAVTDEQNQPNTRNLLPEDMFADLIRNLFPDNMVAATMQKSQTIYTKQMHLAEQNLTLGPTNETVEYLKRSVGSASGTNILGLIIICAALGTAAAQIGGAALLFVQFFKAVYLIITKVLGWIVWFTPIGVASLIAVSIAAANQLEETFASLGYFVLTVTTGVVIHQLVFIPILYLVFMRKNPFRFIGTLAKPWLTGFAPPSSAIAIPEMMRTCEEKLGVDKSISGFVVPLAASLNRDGSCVFITVTATYIGQLAGADLNAGTIITMIVLITVNSLAIPAVTSSSVVTLLIVLSSMNIEPVNIGLIMALEWYTDRIRTAANVMSSVLCTVITNKLCKIRNPDTPAEINETFEAEIKIEISDTNSTTKL